MPIVYKTHNALIFTSLILIFSNNLKKEFYNLNSSTSKEFAYHTTICFELDCSMASSSSSATPPQLTVFPHIVSALE